MFVLAIGDWDSDCDDEDKIMLTAILTNGRTNILYFNHDEKMWDLQIIPFGWSLIQIIKREWAT